MLRNVVAIRRDGFKLKVMTVLFEVPHQDFNLKAAVMAAATDYAKTPEGRRVYEGNCSEITWSDFAWIVPNEFCEKYGFKKVETGVLPDIEVNLDEDLVDEAQIHEEDDEVEE